jgi:anti-sigma B factor antagonist
MPELRVSMTVRRVDGHTSIIDIAGDVTAASESVLMQAFEEATAGGVRVIALNFAGLDYMNSGGIGLLVTLLVRANRQRLRLVAYGLTDHYRQIFELTRLDEAMHLCETEADALADAA